MKKIFFPLLGITLAIAVVTMTAFTGKKDLPASIAHKFSDKYPNAKIRNWEMRDDQYVVKFTEDRSKCMSYFTSGGKWIRTEKLVPLSKDLPPAVRKGFNNSGYADWHIDRIREVTSIDAQPMYVLHIDDGDKLDSWHIDALESNYLIWFSSDGTLMKKTAYVAK